MKEKKYLFTPFHDGPISATGCHPTLLNSIAEGTTEFTVLNAQNKEYSGLITFGSALSLCTDQQGYLAFNASREVKVEPMESAAMSKLIRWTILDANNPASRRPVSCYDDIALKTPFGELICDENSVVFANGQGVSEESTWKLMKANVPYMPDWVYTRQHLAFNELVQIRHPHSDSASKQVVLRRRTFPDEHGSLGNLPLDAQENTLIQDLLYCLCSIEGTYIRRRQESNQSQIRKFVYAVEPYLDSPTCDESLLFLVNKILPLAQHHDIINVYVNIHSHYDFGLVSHALCEAIESLLKDYRLRVTQLDMEANEGKMTLQKLWYYLQPSMRTMENLARFIENSDNLKGGMLLDAIYSFMTAASDPNHKKLFKFLMEQSSIPYLNMLSQWIHYGIIDDPYEEFMVKERKDLNKDTLHRDFNDTYWENRFLYRESQIPVFLHKLRVKVLQTGKYLNVIRECGNQIECPYIDELDPKKNPKLLNSISNQREFIEPIEHAYEWSSKRLLTLILEEQKLIARLKSIKHYFFLDTGDFFVHFMDSAQEELEKHIRQISVEKLESLLEMSLRTSSANSDPFKDDLSCELESYTLMEQLFAIRNITGGGNRRGEMQPIFTTAQHFKGLETFVLNYAVRWPLTLIISRRTLTKYQLIFRHLFFCKYVERQLSNTWLIHQSTKELNLHAAFASSYCLRQRMLHFVKNYIYYMVVEVLEQKWHVFIQKLKNVQTIDDIMRHHDKFLDSCLKECLLLHQELFMILSQIIWNGLYFAEMIQNHTQSMKVDDGYLGQNYGDQGSYMMRRKMKIQKQSSETKKVLMQKRYSYMIDQFTQKFDDLMQKFLKIIHSEQDLRRKSQTENHLINLVIRLDYNGFYLDRFQADDMDIDDSGEIQ